MKYAILTVMSLMICTAVATHAADSEATPTQTGFGGKGGGGGQLRQKMLEKFDTNHDGKLDDTEKEAMKAALHAKMLEKFDTNHDGKLDDTERAAMKAAIEQRRAQHGGGQGGAGQGGLRGRFGKRANGDAGAGAGAAKKTSDANPDTDSVQKVMDQVDAKPPVRF